MKYYQDPKNKNIVYKISLIGRSKNRYWVTIYKNGSKMKESERATEEHLRNIGLFDFEEVDSAKIKVREANLETLEIIEFQEKKEPEEKYVPYFERMQEYDFKGDKIRGIIIDGSPFFVGKDVAKALGYRDTSDALKKHVDEEDKLTRRFADSGQRREMKIINESGLYSLILSSKLPEAKKFKRWVVSEVLPTIRKHGYYSKMDSFMIEDGEMRAQRWLDEYKEKERALALAKANQNKADFCDSVLKDDTLFTATSIAKAYGLTANKLNDILVNAKIQYKSVDGNNACYQLFDKYARQGFAKTTLSRVSCSKGDKFHSSLKWTYKGRAFLDSFLKDNGIYPIQNE